MNRPQLDSFVEDKKALFAETFSLLNTSVNTNYYCSLWVEKRNDSVFDKTTRGKSASSSSSAGIVLRVFDGVTLFESAKDDFSKESLTEAVNSLAAKVKAEGALADAPVYVSPSWKERAHKSLEEDLLSQIDIEASADEWIHFANKFSTPLMSSSEELMAYVDEKFSQLMSIKEDFIKNHDLAGVDYERLLVNLQRDDFLFIDSSVRMTQTLLRNRTAGMATKGEESARAMFGGLGGQETIDLPEKSMRMLFQELKDLLKADKLTPGKYKLLMGPALTGVFAHEAFGHSQEGDTWARGRSKCKELYESQESVGNEHATILNNPAIYDNGLDPFAAWGSYFFDEEGWLAEESYLVKEGKLTSPMTNMTSAFRLGVKRTSNGKRENWKNAIYTRQTNTYFSAGDKTYEDLIKMIDYGFVAEGTAGGMEDPKGMGIQVGIPLLYEVKDGKFTGKTFKGPNGGDVQMTGYVPDCLSKIIDKSKIDAHGEKNNFTPKHPWNEVGGCGKYHKELVNAGCGGTYLLVDQVLLG